MNRIVGLSIILLTVCALFMGGCQRQMECCDVETTADIDWTPAPPPVEKVVAETPKEPVEPVKEPTEPVTEPTEPVKEPTEPVTEPTEPVEEPVKEPTEPVKEPTEPVEPDPIDLPPVEQKTKAVLESVVSGKNEAELGTSASLVCNVENKGDGAAESYKVQLTFPEGLTSEDGKSSMLMDGSKLEPQDKAPFPFSVKAQKSGKYTITADVLLNNQPAHQSKYEVTFIAKPVLEVKIDGPASFFIDKAFEYTVQVKNAGLEGLTGVALQSKMDADKVAYISANPEGKFNEDEYVITWEVGDLPAGETRSFTVKVQGIKAGGAENQARVKCTEGARANAKLVTEIKVEIALQLSHSETNDPVEVDSKTTYIIEILNQGFKDATSVKVTDTIPEESSFVEAVVEGAENIQHKVEGQVVTFDEIPVIAPGKRVVFKVTVLVEKVGDLLNHVEVSTSNFADGKPLITEQGTKSFQG